MPTADDYDELPNWKAMCIIAEKFDSHGIPRKYASLIEFDLDESFFANKEKAEEFIEAFTKVIINMYDVAYDEFGEEDVQYVFEQLVSEIKLTAKGGHW